MLHKIPKGSELFSTASPFSDSRIALRLKVKLNDEVVFDNFKEEEQVIWYDMDYYQIPAAFRRVLKLSKLHEIVEMTSNREVKLLDFLPDTQNKIFDHQKIKSALENNGKVQITFKLLEIQYKNNPSKLKIAGRVERLREIYQVANAFFTRAVSIKQMDEADVTTIQKQIQNIDFKKVIKLCLRTERFYKKKEQASVFEEEDEESLEFKNDAEIIYGIHKDNFMLHSKTLQLQNNLKAALAKINTCLEKIDHRDY